MVRAHSPRPTRSIRAALHTNLLPRPTAPLLSLPRAALALAPLTKHALPVLVRAAPAHPEASAAHTPLVRAHLPGPAPRRAHSPASPSSRPRPSLSLSARFSRFSLFASHSLPAAVRTRRLGCAAASGDHGQGVRVHAPPPRPGDGWEGGEGGWGREGGKGRRRKKGGGEGNGAWRVGEDREGHYFSHTSGGPRGPPTLSQEHLPTDPTGRRDTPRIYIWRAGNVGS